jgi:acetyl esterase/lipase
MLRYLVGLLCWFSLMVSSPLASAQKVWPVYAWPTDPVVPSATAPTDRQVLRLYPPKAGETPATLRSSLETPGMEVFVPKPENATGKAIVLVPGGSYHHITASKIFTMAEMLRGQGATVFVLFYRYGTSNPCPIPLADGARAVRIVRAFAQAWKLDKAQVTMIGASAAGHMVGWLAAQGAIGEAKSADPIERESSKPDLVALLSPVISMREDWAGTRANTLPAGADVKVFGETYSVDMLVNKTIPPMFIWHAKDDKAVNAASNSGRLVAALEKLGVACTYSNTDTGGHVSSWNDIWGKPLLEWLRKYKVVGTIPTPAPPK